MPKAHPILFSGPMVRAILEGRKYQTRRVMKPQPHNPCVLGDVARGACPYGEAGDLLWVRTTWWRYAYGTMNEQAWDEFTRTIRWKGIDGKIEQCGIELKVGWRKRPSIHMPRWASLIVLRIKSVTAQRLQEISEEDAMAEGVWGLNEPYQGVGDLPTDRFCRLWDSLNAKRGYAWVSNPWVWRIEFEAVKEDKT